MSIKLKLSLTSIACLAALASPAGASAATCAPPGNSSVSQYVESVPGSSCNQSSSGSGHHGSLPAGTSTQLAKQGAVGAAVARLVSSSGTGGGSGTSGGTGAGGGTGATGGGRGGSVSSGSPKGARGAGLSGSGSNPVSGVLHPVLTGSSSGGIGVLLPVFLVAAFVIALAAIVVRRRFRST